MGCISRKSHPTAFRSCHIRARRDHGPSWHGAALAHESALEGKACAESGTPRDGRASAAATHRGLLESRTSWNPRRPVARRPTRGRAPRPTTKTTTTATAVAAGAAKRPARGPGPGGAGRRRSQGQKGAARRDGPRAVAEFVDKTEHVADGRPLKPVSPKPRAPTLTCTTGRVWLTLGVKRQGADPETPAATAWQSTTRRRRARSPSCFKMRLSLLRCLGGLLSLSLSLSPSLCVCVCTPPLSPVTIRRDFSH